MFRIISPFLPLIAFQFPVVLIIGIIISSSGIVVILDARTSMMSEKPFIEQIVAIFYHGTKWSCYNADKNEYNFIKLTDMLNRRTVLTLIIYFDVVSKVTLDNCTTFK